MDYPAYPVYRESGIEWLGKIPDHWEVVRTRFLITHIEQGWSPQCFNHSAEDGEWGVLKVGCVNGNHFDHNENKALPEEIEPRVEYEINAGDILVSRANTKELLGSATLVPHNNRSRLLLCDKLYRLVLGQSLISEFFIFFLRSFATRPHYERDATGASGSMQNIGQDTVKNLPVTIPPRSEQIQIAQFLDHKTQQIDQLIAKKQTLIDKLNEQRIALITHAVTKGLNPDVTLVDSGVEWLGKVPKHWEISKLGYFSESLQTGPFGSQIHAEEYIDGGIPLINPAEIINGILRYNPRVTVDYATAERLKRHQLMEGDIVIARRGEMGRAGLTKKENVGWLCGTGSLRARLETEKLMPEYLLQLFSLSGTADYLSLQSVGSTMDNLNTSILNQLPIIVPPIEEQREIEAYLDKETARIDQMVGINQQTIDKLKEYRTALITAAVTGKIDLRNWQQEANHANP
jgi:type I restriction enzyme S subunit